MDQVSQPLLGILAVGLREVRGHVERPLSQEGLGIWRHVRQVVHHHEHLDYGAERIEQGDLRSMF